MATTSVRSAPSSASTWDPSSKLLRFKPGAPHLPLSADVGSARHRAVFFSSQCQPRECYKQTQPLMSSQRTPKPVRSYHLIALVLLAAFVAQCSWFIASVPIGQLEADQVLRGVAVCGHTPVGRRAVLLAPGAIALRRRHGLSAAARPAPARSVWLDQHRWFIRAPFLLAGLALALSLWYVARRLYGSAAGHIALALYAFSPGIVARSSLAGPQIFAAWGAFGLIFTAIATAHTLYAPREVIFWNWKRIVLLGVSITFAVGAQWPLVWLLVPAAAFMLWAVPHRRLAAMLILAAAVTVALLLLDACYRADVRALADGLAQAGWAVWTPQLLSLRLLGRIVAGFFLNAAPAALLAFCLPSRLGASGAAAASSATRPRSSSFSSCSPCPSSFRRTAHPQSCLQPSRSFCSSSPESSPISSRAACRRPRTLHLCRHRGAGCLQHRQPDAHLLAAYGFLAERPRPERHRLPRTRLRSRAPAAGAAVGCRVPGCEAERPRPWSGIGCQESTRLRSRAPAAGAASVAAYPAAKLLCG